ncbi:MAG: peroxide stress protein YaaA [Flavobacteriales bacterium]|nr:peroxide stress protein YaaA [Flavobacteriales bacterium]
MKVLLSPAKLMDLNVNRKVEIASNPRFIKDASEIQKQLKQLSVSEISELMKLSPKLSELNWTRNQNWNKNPKNEESVSAIFGFKGEVYRGLDAESLSDKTLIYAQEHLYILSGLYGILKPFDRIMEYRLEMGSKFPLESYKNLPDFWEEKVTKYIKKELSKEEIIVNLASAEYSKAVNFKSIKNPVLEITFKEFRNGTYKSIMSYFKHARGVMARYILENQIKTKEDLLLFNEDKYEFNSELSSNNELVFTR